MTNEEMEERAREYTDWTFDYTSRATYEGSVMKLVELLTQVRNEAIEECAKLSESMLDVNGYDGYCLCKHGDDIAQAIEALKDGAK